MEQETEVLQLEQVQNLDFSQVLLNKNVDDIVKPNTEGKGVPNIINTPVKVKCHKGEGDENQTLSKESSGKIKKKKGRIVSSRYMQIYAKSKTENKSSSKDFKTNSAEQSNIQKSKKTKCWQTLTPTTSTQIWTASSTSTPTGNSHVPRLCHDASAITSDVSQIHAAAAKRDAVTAIPIIKNSGKANKISQQPSKLVQKLKSQQDLTVKPKQKLGSLQQSLFKRTDKRELNKKYICDETSPVYLDMLHGIYLQTVYLDLVSKQRKTEREEIAMDHISQLAQLNEKLRAKAAAQDLEIAQLRHNNLLDEQLDSQMEKLTDVLNKLNNGTSELENMISALDETRHQLIFKNFSPNDESKPEMITSELLKCENSFKPVDSLYLEKYSEIERLAENLSTLKDLVNKELTDVIESQRLIDATCSLSLQETSYKIEAIQSSHHSVAENEKNL